MPIYGFYVKYYTFNALGSRMTWNWFGWSPDHARCIACKTKTSHFPLSHLLEIEITVGIAVLGRWSQRRFLLCGVQFRGKKEEKTLGAEQLRFPRYRIIKTHLLSEERRLLCYTFHRRLQQHQPCKNNGYNKRQKITCRDDDVNCLNEYIIAFFFSSILHPSITIIF